MMAHVDERTEHRADQVGSALGPCMLLVPARGAGPTAVSVVSDVVDVGAILLSDAAGSCPPPGFPRGGVLRATRVCATSGNASVSTACGLP